MPLRKNNFLRCPSKVVERRSQRHGPRSTIYELNGDQYKGEWKNDMKHGMGQQVWKSGANYIGDWKYGKCDGYGTYTKGNQLYIGEWRNGKKHGHGKYAYSDLAYYHGEWRKGHRSGWGEMHYENGDVFMGEWLLDKRHGRGIIRYIGGDWYEGEWQYDEKHGKGKLYFAEKGKQYVGMWVNGEAKCGTLTDCEGVEVENEIGAGTSNEKLVIPTAKTQENKNKQGDEEPKETVEDGGSATLELPSAETCQEETNEQTDEEAKEGSSETLAETLQEQSEE
ncbi:MORN repeat-containing protein 3-like [Solea solea]|uniref:MORN repeat-containing protein 3-like n=1 Tax=Solea solea TaxID=90069 RepID=UPI00272C1632|nr:MORN repeat-containing protein 3-like [Solea solea]